jgi:3-oxoacyl-[acyl-carrier protein] reductase
MTTSGVAMVTGASRGVGAATVRRLARDGFAVAINTYPDSAMKEAAFELKAEVGEGGGRAEVFVCDITSEVDVEAMVGACESALGPVTALVLNAAAIGRYPWDQMGLAEWNRVLSVNLTGAYICARAVAGQGRAGLRSMVAVSSIQAMTGVEWSLAYGTTKAGLVGFTRSMARALGPIGIRVNCVMPGAIRTELEREMTSDKDLDTRLLDLQCLKRRGEPEDVANVISFLIGPSSSFVTGQTLCIDGGWVFR